MKRLAILALPFMCLAGPAVAADLEGPPYPERESYVRPPIVDRKIVEHHHYHHQAPTVYREKRVYVEPRVYEEPVYTRSPSTRAALPSRIATGGLATSSRGGITGHTEVVTGTGEAHST